MDSNTEPTGLLLAIRNVRDELYQVPNGEAKGPRRRQLIRQLDMLSHLLLISALPHEALAP